MQARFNFEKWSKIKFIIAELVCKLWCVMRLTPRTRSRQRWRLMSLRRSTGSPLRRVSSSTPRVASHLYWSYLRTDSLNSGGNCLWCIHCSVSVLFTLHSSNRTVVDCRYVCKIPLLLSYIWLINICQFKLMKWNVFLKFNLANSYSNYLHITN